MRVLKGEKPRVQQKRLKAELGDLGEGFGALLGKQEEEVGNQEGPIYC